MPDDTHQFEFLWNCHGLSGAQLRVGMSQIGDAPWDIWLEANKPSSQTIRGTEVLEVRAFLPSGQTFQKLFDLGKIASGDEPIKVTIPAVAEGSPQPEQSLYRALGTTGRAPKAAIPKKKETIDERFSRRLEWASSVDLPRKEAKLSDAGVRIWNYVPGNSPQERWVEDLDLEPEREEGGNFDIVHLERQSRRARDGRPNRLLELRVPGFLSRFKILPPLDRLNVLIRKSQDPVYGPPCGGLTMKFVPFADDSDLQGILQTALSYGRGGALDEMRASALLLRDMLLRPPFSDPNAVSGEAAPTTHASRCAAYSSRKRSWRESGLFAAWVSLYYLIRTQSVRELPAGFLSEFRRNTDRHRADSWLLSAWLLMTDDTPDAVQGSKIRTAISRAAALPSPLFAMGSRFLFEQMRILRKSLSSADSSDRVFRSEVLDPAILRLGSILGASVPTEQFTTYLGVSPSEPTLQLPFGLGTTAPAAHEPIPSGNLSQPLEQPPVHLEMVFD